VHRAGHQRDLGAGLAAARAMAKPILPDEWLVMPRIGSSASKVGPAVTSTFWPASSLGCEEGDDVFEQLRRLEHAAVAGLAAGLEAAAHAQHGGAVGRQLHQVALGGRVRPHLAVHGRRDQQRHRSIGRARHIRLSRSSARPCTSRAMKSALHGAITMASASRLRLMCGMLLGSRASHCEV
jgi:hypothetical protein